MYAETGTAHVSHVKIPEGVYAGDTFDVALPTSGKVVTVRCPEGLEQGKIMELRVYETAPTVAVVSAPMVQYQIRDTTVGEAVYTLSWWLVVDIILLGLLLAAATVPIFAFQTIPSGCNSIADPPLPTKLYYNLWQGVGTTPECKQTDTDYCIKWSNSKAWSYMDSITGSNMAYDTNSIVGSQSLLTIAVIVTFIFLTYHTYILSKTVSTGVMGPTLMIYNSASWYLFFTWILAVIAFNLFLYADQLRMSYWQSVWVSGYTIPDILHQTGPSVAISTECAPNLVLSQGLTILGVATAFAFISSIVICCITCMRC